MMAFAMLCGRLPVSGGCHHYSESTGQMCRMTDPLWDHVTPRAKDFVRGLLVVNPAERLSIDDALHHAWLTLEEWRVDVSTMQRVLQNMRSFRPSSRLFSVCAAAVARHLDPRGLDEVRQVFREMDGNGDGVLQLHEMRDAFIRVFGEDGPRLQEIEQVFSRLDLGGTGEVAFSEFCAAGLGGSLFANTDSLGVAIEAFAAHGGDRRVIQKEVAQAFANAELQADQRSQVMQDIFARFGEGGDVAPGVQDESGSNAFAFDACGMR